MNPTGLEAAWILAGIGGVMAMFSCMAISMGMDKRTREIARYPFACGVALCVPIVVRMLILAVAT